MHIIVIGAGVIGVSTAHALAEAGHAVTVLEAERAPAQGTSHANGGQLSYGHAEPWANRSLLTTLLRGLVRPDAPIRLHLPLNLPEMMFGMGWMRQALSPARQVRATQQLWELACESRAQMQALHHSLSFDYAASGTLHLFRDAASLARATQQAQAMERLGCRVQPLSSTACREREPGLAEASHLAGGLYFPDDAMGDACAFTEALATHLGKAGVGFRYGSAVTALAHEGKGWRVTDSQGTAYTADAVVVAGGAGSGPLLAPLGIRTGIVPVRGYSLTTEIGTESALQGAITDPARKLVYSRLGNRLRVAGYGDIGLTTNATQADRFRQLQRDVATWFPWVGDARPEFWTGLRPMTASALPVMREVQPNLWLHAGHGSLGWTLALGSSALLAKKLAS
jgi:D-amino-acid dehydrogenase